MAGTGAQTDRIIQKALDCGASLAGVTTVAALAGSRSYAGKAPIKCPVKGHSLLVLALAQGNRWPEFDWWDNRPGGTQGNRRLSEIMEKMIDWLADEETIQAGALPYNIEKGGIFLKGAAILAGLGTIGKNNLLITPHFGPRVRLRAVLINGALSQTGPVDFNPCRNCDMACRSACPQNAYENGVFDRKRCSIQMRMDKLAAGGISGAGGAFDQVSLVIYCRACELACPLASA